MSRSAVLPPSYPGRDAQDVENHRAVAAVAALAENAFGIAENLSSYVENRLPSLEANGEQLLAAVEELSLRYRHDRPAGWDEARYLAECDQHVTPQTIEELYTRPTLDVAGIKASLQQFKDPSLTRGRYLVTRDALKALQPHAGSKTVLNVPAALTALRDVQYIGPTEAIKDELAGMEGQRQKYAKAVTDAQRAFEAARASGDVVEVERTHRHLIAARYEHVVCCAKRLHFLVSTEGDDEHLHYGDKMEQVRVDAEDAVRGFREDKEQLRQQLQADLVKCREAREKAAGEHEAAQSAFQQEKKSLERELASLVGRKLELAQELRQKALELCSVMDEQRAVSQEVAQAVKVEAQRQTAHREFVQLGDQHVNRLQTCLQYCAMCEPLVEEMESYVEVTKKTLPNDVQAGLQGIVDHESESFLQAYRAFVYACGELTVKKAHRLDTLERQARLAQHNRDSAMDSLDPNYEQYRVELAEVLAQAQAVEGVMNALHATQDAGEQVFESVEDVVVAACARAHRPFVHPLQEFGHESVAARSEFVDRSLKYVVGEEHEVTAKRTQLAEQKALVDREQHALDQAVATAAIAASSASAGNAAATGNTAAPPQVEA